MSRSSRKLADRLSDVETSMASDRCGFALPDGRTLKLPTKQMLLVVTGQTDTVHDAAGRPLSDMDVYLLGRATPQQDSMLASTVVQAARWVAAGTYPECPADELGVVS